MTENQNHVVTELGAYVLDALDGDERRRLDAHLEACDACAQELRHYRAVAGALPLALPPLSPPADAWRRIHEMVGRPAVRRRSTPEAVWRWVRAARWPAAVAVTLVLVAWNVTLHRQLWRYAEGPQVEKLARRPGRLVILGSPTLPHASARLFAAVDGRGGHLAVSGLKPLPADRVYQLWFLRRSAAPGHAATFTVDDAGRAWVVVSVPRPLDETDAIVVTEEPAPGSSAPTGPRSLEATQWR